ncbi:MAG TPA: sulfite exporter TauE/SafE family protein, partial [Candidatus Acidoferrales bacterium]
GSINSVAGGGSFISFPALIFAGVPPIEANATNTAALFPGTLASTFAYRKALDAKARRLLPPLIITGIIGGVLGARILLITPQATFLHLVPWLLLAATLLFVFSGRLTAWVRSRAGLVASSPDAKTPRLLLIPGLFLQLLIAIYVGYFGAGVGILVLALLAFLGMENIHAMNGMKALLVSIVNGGALVTFIAAHIVLWPQAALMLVGAVAGGYGGAYLAQRVNPQYIRWVVIGIGFGMSAYFFIRY